MDLAFLHLNCSSSSSALLTRRTLSVNPEPGLIWTFAAPKSQDFVLTGLDEDHLETAPSGLPWGSRSLVLSFTTLRTAESVRRGQITHLVLDEVLFSDTYLCRSPNAFPFPGFFHSVIGYDCATVRRTNDDGEHDTGDGTNNPNIVVLGQIDNVEIRMSEGKWEPS